MRILIFNWRDIKNPEGGGAEVLTHEMAKRWVKWGHQVTQFSAAFPGGKSEEVIEGVKIIRRGNPAIRSLGASVHLVACWWYLKKGKEQFDVVVDEIHGLPFFTPFYVKEKKVALICEVAQEIWDYVLPFPFNLLGRLQEKFYFNFYQKIPFLTISPSTKKDLINYGIKEENIFVLPMGFNKPTLKKFPSKEKKPVIIFIGRLTKAKGVADAIRAFELIKKKIPKALFWIVGSGDDGYRNELKYLVKKLRLEDKVIFWGFVSEKEKWRLMRKAHVMVAPSAREGWGLIVPEAGLMETPVIVYNVPGFRDVVEDGVSGLICQDNTPENLAKNVIKLLNDKKLYNNLSKNAERKARKMDWENTAKAALKVLQEAWKKY